MDLNSGKGVTAPKVLIAETVRWPHVALFAMDFAKAGCRVSAVCPSRHPLYKTDVLEQIFHYNGLFPLDSLTTAIEATKPHLIVPCDDRAVQHLHELYAHACQLGNAGRPIAALIEKSLGPASSYPMLLDRYNFLRLAHEEGLRAPETEAIRSLDDLKSLQSRLAFPWVLKTDGTYGGKGVKIARTMQEAEQFMFELNHFYSAKRAIKRIFVNRDTFWLRPWLNATQPAICVQSFISGHPANCVVACWRGKLLAGIGVEVVGDPEETGPASMVRVVESPEMLAFAEKIARRLELSGFFGLDFMIEEKSGLAHLIEINPRLTRLGRLQLGKGRDLIGAIHAQLTGQPAREIPPVTQNPLIAYFPDAWDNRSKLLDSSYHDGMVGDPELLQELRHPFPTRTLLSRLVNRASSLKASAQKPG